MPPLSVQQSRRSGGRLLLPQSLRILGQSPRRGPGRQEAMPRTHLLFHSFTLSLSRPMNHYDDHSYSPHLTAQQQQQQQKYCTLFQSQQSYFHHRIKPSREQQTGSLSCSRASVQYGSVDYLVLPYTQYGTLCTSFRPSVLLHVQTPKFSFHQSSSFLSSAQFFSAQLSSSDSAYTSTSTSSYCTYACNW